MSRGGDVGGGRVVGGDAEPIRTGRCRIGRGPVAAGGREFGAVVGDFSGATAASYELAAGDVGKFVRARVSYTDGHGANKSAESAAQGPIGATNVTPSFADAAVSRSVSENVTSGECGRGGHRLRRRRCDVGVFGGRHQRRGRGDASHGVQRGFRDRRQLGAGHV